MKKKIFNVLKIIVSIALIVFILSKMRGQELLQAIKSANYFYLVPAVLLYFSAIVLSSLRWQIFLKVVDISNNFWNLLKFYLISIFAGNFLPSGGLDVVRAYYVGRGGKMSKAFAATFIDRLSGFYAILFYLILAAILISVRIKSLFSLTVLGIAVILLLNILIFNKGFAQIVQKIKKTRFTTPIVNFLLVLHSYRQQIRVIFYTLPISILIQFFFSLVPIIIAPGLGVQIPFWESILLLPIINFIMMIPVTISGLGLREGAFIILYGELIGNEKALILSLLYYFTSVIISIAGWILFLFDKPEKDIVKISE